MSGWQEFAEVGERRAAGVLAQLVNRRGPVPAEEMVAAVPQFSSDPAAAREQLEQDIALLCSYGLEIERANMERETFAIAPSSWQRRPVSLDEIDSALLDRALKLAGPRSEALADAVSLLRGHRAQRQALATVSLSPRGSAARGRPEAYSRLHRLAGLLERRVIAGFGYPGLDGLSVGRTLRILGLGESRGIWFAVGMDESSDVVRAFAVSEMRGPVAEASREHAYEVPPDFDVARYLALAWRLGPDPYVATVRFDETLATFAATMLEEFEPAPVESGLDVKLPVGDTDAFVGWVLSFGTHARILDPAAAVDRARETLAGVVARHG